MARTWIVRVIGAALMVGVVHLMMIGFATPTPAAWYLGAVIYAGLVAILFSNRSVLDKLGFYLVFVVVSVVGALTVCPCTHVHLLFAPLAGLAAFWLFHSIKRNVMQPPTFSEN